MEGKIRVAYVGDSPFIYSGFGVVAKAILSRLDPDIFDVSALGTMFHHYPSRDATKSIPALDYYTPTCVHDSMGFKAIVEFLQYANPDVLFFIGDPGTLRNRFSTLMMTGLQNAIPAVTYFPLEGAPFNPHIVEQANMVKGPVTYTKWGADILKGMEVEVDWVWHGADHAPFEQYSDDVRSKLRELVGWRDRFVVGTVGVNKRTNRQPVMIETMRILKDRGFDDVQLYMHCQTVGDMVMGGWDLGWLIEAYGVEDSVQLKPNQAEHQYIGRPRVGTLEEMLNRPNPQSKEDEMDNLAALDFVSLLNVPDLYIDPASAHGFNLPAAEAARCGVPIAVVDDKFARSEIFGSCAYMMNPSATDYWHTGAVLPLVSPTVLADTVDKFYSDSELCLSVGAQSKGFFDAIKWDPVADLFTEKLLAAYEWGLEMIGKSPKPVDVAVD